MMEKVKIINRALNKTCLSHIPKNISKKTGKSHCPELVMGASGSFVMLILGQHLLVQKDDGAALHTGIQPAGGRGGHTGVFSFNRKPHYCF